MKLGFTPIEYGDCITVEWQCKVSHYFTNSHKIRVSTDRYYNCLRFEYDFAAKIIL